LDEFQQYFLISRAEYFNLLVSQLVFFIYVMPSVIAFIRDSRNKLLIVLINFLLGWTFVGWVFALIWAARKKTSSQLMSKYTLIVR